MTTSSYCKISREDYQRHQMCWSINVWCSIWKDLLLEPMVYDGTSYGQRYFQLLQNIIPNFIDDIPLSASRYFCFIHGGALVHHPVAMWSFIKDSFGEQIIEYDGWVEWPLRSPDLNPFNFFLWGYKFMISSMLKKFMGIYSHKYKSLSWATDITSKILKINYSSVWDNFVCVCVWFIKMYWRKCVFMQ